MSNTGKLSLKDQLREMLRGNDAAGISRLMDIPFPFCLAMCLVVTQWREAIRAGSVTQKQYDAAVDGLIIQILSESNRHDD